MGRRGWAVLIGGALLIGACNAQLGSASGASGLTLSERWDLMLDAVADSTSSQRSTSARTGTCDDPAEGGLYSGLPGCRPGGETATVAHVIDGDTLRLTDGREIQLIGIDAPEVDDCAGDDATRHSRSRVEGRRITLHDDPGVGTDRTGRTLAYVRYAGPDTDYDLGYSLVYNGLAVPYPAYAGNIRYTANIARAADERPTATGTCEQPPVTTDPAEDSDRNRRPAAPLFDVPRAPDALPAPAPRSVYYPDCAAARAAGAVPLRLGDPGYRDALDRDGDAVACE
ncbi:thermonuclease family protein [Pseudonocardia saturnea]